MDIAQIALGAYQSRRRAAARKRAAAEWTRDQAEADVRPWAAMACRLGADVPELREMMDGIVVLIGPEITEMQRRAIVADDLCTRRQLVAALGPARDKAMNRYEAACKADAAPDKVEALRTVALGLCALANHFAWDVNGKLFIRPYAWPADLPYPPRREAAPVALLEQAA